MYAGIDLQSPQSLLVSRELARVGVIRAEGLEKPIDLHLRRHRTGGFAAINDHAGFEEQDPARKYQSGRDPLHADRTHPGRVKTIRSPTRRE